MVIKSGGIRQDLCMRRHGFLDLSLPVLAIELPFDADGAYSLLASPFSGLLHDYRPLLWTISLPKPESLATHILDVGMDLQPAGVAPFGCHEQHDRPGLMMGS